VNVIEGDALPDLMNRLPIVATLPLLLLLVSLRDRATELRFEPWNDETEGRILRLFYEVDGQTDEFVHAPGFVVEAVVNQLRHLSGLKMPRRRLAGALRRLAARLDGEPAPAASGRFGIRFGADSIEVAATFYPSPLGDRVYLRFPEVGPLTAEAADRALKRVVAERDS
jgi:hypothetical protein